jgi:hypothetical protein
MMAQTLRIAARTAAIGFLVASCGDGGGGGNDAVPVVFDDGNAAELPVAGGSGACGSIQFDLGGELDEGEVLTVGASEGSDGIVVSRVGNFLRFLLHDASGETREVAYPIADWTSDDAHSLTVTWGEGRTSLYVDGGRIGSTLYSGHFDLPPGTPIYLGSDGAGGRISDFRVYGRPLDPSEVRETTPARGPTLSLSSPVVSDNSHVARVCVHLDSAGEEIAGTQNEIVWDPSCATLSDRSCSLLARHTTLNTSQPGSSVMRAFVFAFNNVDPLPDGDLYCCDVVVQAVGGDACCPLRLEGARGSTPEGKSVALRAVHGEICPAGAPVCQH